MHDNHKRAVNRLVEQFQPDSRFLALIIGGSVAKGWADDYADLDFLLVATEQEYQRRAAALDFSIITDII